MFNLIPLIMSMFISAPPVKPVPPYFSPVSVTREFRKVSKSPRIAATEGSLFDSPDSDMNNTDQTGTDNSVYNNGINDYSTGNDNGTRIDGNIGDNGNRTDYNNGSDNSYNPEDNYNSDNSQNDNYNQNDYGYDFSDYGTKKEELDNKYSRRAELREKIISSLVDVITYYEEYNELTCSYKRELRGILGGNNGNYGDMQRPMPKPMPEPTPAPQPIPDQDPVDPAYNGGENILPDNGSTSNYTLSESSSQN